MENLNPAPLDRFNHWLKESVMIKLFSIGFLILLLLIPSAWIQSLMEERQGRAAEVVAEISSKWSGSQTMMGPILVIPFTKIEKVKRWEKEKLIEEVTEHTQRAYFLPDQLLLESNIKPQVRHRGIFDAVVYDASISLTATFASPDFTRWSIPDNQIHWKDASLVTGISDMRGISDNPVIRSTTQTFVAEPINNIGVNMREPVDTMDDPVQGVSTLLGWTSRADVFDTISMTIQLKGSERLFFVPVGRTTEVKMAGDWASPSFDGSLLPAQDPIITDQTFSAHWKILSFNRPFAQQWVDQDQHLGGSSFGVRLDLPADQYQKSIRTAKYGKLIIILAFTALFLVEIGSKVRIHPFQYILIGIALIIYYTLLLSISEQFGFDTAYAIASTATITLIGLYALSFLTKRSLVIIFTLLMILFYVFIFVIVQAQDYSLLIGSIGLFLIVAAVMYFSRKIKWYKE
jgi:inner membrane protein